MMIVVEEIEKNLHDAEHKKIGKCLRLRTPQKLLLAELGRTNQILLMSVCKDNGITFIYIWDNM